MLHERQRSKHFYFCVKLFEPGSLWSYKGYRLFWFSTTIFVLGASAFPIALAVTVLDAGGTASTLGLILGARVLSGVVFAPFAGVWADRLPRKKVMMGADQFRSAIVLSMVFISAPAMPHYLLGLAVLLMGVGDAFGASAAGAIMPSLVPDDKLPAANVGRNIVTKAATIIGPGIGGLSVFLIGGRFTFLFTAIAFALSATAFSIGSIISALLCVKMKVKHEGYVSIFVWMFIIIAPLALAFPINGTFIVLAYLLAGFSVGPWEAWWSSAVQREVPAHLQGRVFSIDHMGSAGLMPIGMALIGPAVSVFGEKQLLIGASIFHIVVCMSILRVPGVKDMRMPANYSHGEHK